MTTNADGSNIRVASQLPMSRREVNRLIAAAAVGGAIGGIGSGASALPARPAQQPDPNAPPAKPKSFLDDVLKRNKPHDWILKPFIHIQSYQEDPARVPKDRMIRIEPIAFKTAAVVFPVIRGTASSETDIDNVKSVLKFDDRPVDLKPEYNESYHSNVRLGRWEMRDLMGREADLELEIPMTCWETTFDERIAAKAVWPAAGKWPAGAASTMRPQARIDDLAADAAALRQLVTTWTEGKSPQSVSPLMLAKVFAAKVVEHFQPSGEGEEYNKFGAFTGLDLQGPAVTVQKGTGSPHDIASLLCGVYRHAGLPARLVVGHDEAGDNGDGDRLYKRARGGVRLRSWVEFCLYDETAATEAWIPVDIVRIRSRSSRPGKLDQPWKFFGTHDELDSVLPFAFHYLPPTTVVSYGYAFWGWFTTPTTQIAKHFVRFTAQTAPKRARDQRDRDRPRGR